MWWKLFLLWVFLGTPLGLDLAAWLLGWRWRLEHYVIPWLVSLFVLMAITVLYLADATFFKGISAS